MATTNFLQLLLTPFTRLNLLICIFSLKIDWWEAVGAVLPAFGCCTAEVLDFFPLTVKKMRVTLTSFDAPVDSVFW